MGNEYDDILAAIPTPSGSSEHRAIYEVLEDTLATLEPGLSDAEVRMALVNTLEEVIETATWMRSKVDA